MWAESRGGPTAQQRFEEVHATPAEDPFWAVPPGDPGPADLFAPAVYDRSAAALHALRGEVGEEPFRTLLRRWATENAGGNVGSADLVALAEEVGGQDLGAFFTTWIDTPGKPVTW